MFILLTIPNMLCSAFKFQADPSILTFCFYISGTQANNGGLLSELELAQNSDRVPNFITPGQTYRIATGATVVLPCRVSEPGK